MIGFTIKHRQQGLQPLTVATWALVQQAAQDLTREVGSIHRDVTHLEDHCRQLSALRAFENVLPKRSARHVVPADRSTKKSEEYEKDKNDLRAEHSPAIEVSNVSFNYPRRTEQVLHNISFNVNRGEMVALVGLNGSSKSTLVKLISGCVFVTLLLPAREIRLTASVGPTVFQLIKVAFA